MGTILGIMPLIHVDGSGKLVAVGKPRGKKKGLEALLASMEKGWLPEISKQVIIWHGDSPEVAQELRTLVAARFPEAEIFIAPIGPVIGAHAGPGVMTVFFYLSLEASRRVSLGEDDIRLIPSAIGGDRDKRTGVIPATSIPAKKFGIKTGFQALYSILHDPNFSHSAKIPIRSCF